MTAALGWTIGGPYSGEASSGNTVFWGTVDGAVVYANKRDDRASSSRAEQQQDNQLQNLDMSDHYWDAYRAPTAVASPPASGGGGFNLLRLPLIPVPIPDVPIPVP